LNIAQLEDFLAAMKNDPVVRTSAASIEFTKRSLPKSRTIVVLEHCR
jgi:hypothetical protein